MALPMGPKTNYANNYAHKMGQVLYSVMCGGGGYEKVGEVFVTHNKSVLKREARGGGRAEGKERWLP